MDKIQSPTSTGNLKFPCVIIMLLLYLHAFVLCELTNLESRSLDKRQNETGEMVGSEEFS